MIMHKDINTELENYYLEIRLIDLYHCVATMYTKNDKQQMLIQVEYSDELHLDYIKVANDIVKKYETVDASNLKAFNEWNGVVKYIDESS